MNAKKIFINISRIFIKILLFIVVFSSGFLYFGSNYVKDVYGDVPMDSLVFTIMNPLEGTEGGQITGFIKHCIIPPVAIAVAAIIVFIFLAEKTYRIEYSEAFQDEGRKTISFNPSKIIVASSYIAPFLILVACFNYAMTRVELLDYIKESRNDSQFIEQNYIDPKDVQITFPKNKRNLIYIYMESLESSFMSKELGGVMDENRIPLMTELARNNTNFSDSNNIGGAFQVHGTGWTIAAMVAHTSGLPFKFRSEVQNTVNEYQEFLPKIQTLGDILDGAGYNQVLMVGSDSDYGGRKKYFEQHGNYTVKDLFTAREEGAIPRDYKVWWGFEDQKLYEYAKTEIKKLAAQDDPFNFSLLTADTHNPQGYVCSLCNKEEFPKQYDNVIACADRQIAGFVSWIQAQDFYDDTTIVIVGDHLTMVKYIETGNKRIVFNTFINPASVLSHDKTHNRIFTVMDFFPTTLAALGVEIEGDRLGLGTDLFSGTSTLAEIYGIDKFDEEISKKSNFYNSKLY